MEQYIKKSALVAEIEKRRKLVSDPILSCNDLMIGERNALFNLLSFIESLEVKEVDLEEYYHKFLQKEWFGNSHVRTVSEMMAFTAKHFFELGLKAQKGE